MGKQQVKNGKRGRKNDFIVDGPKFTHEEIRDALFNVQDALERSQIQFVLLDELAKQLNDIEDPILEASEVSIGVRQQDFTESGSSTLRSIIPQAGWELLRHDETVSNLNYNVGSVPVVVWIIHNNFDVLNYPDTKFFYNTEFKLPNPFTRYWAKRDLLR